MGPQYKSETMFAPSYIVYTPGNNLYSGATDTDDEDAPKVGSSDIGKTSGKSSSVSGKSKSTGNRSSGK